MKFIHILFLFSFIQTLHGQDFCKQIKKDVSDDKTVYDYSSPFDVMNPPPVRVTRSYSNSKEFSFDNFTLIFQIPCDLDSIYNKVDGAQVEKEEYRLIVEFEDKSKITDDTLKIIHDFTEDRSQALRVLYYPLTERTMKDFTTKKIAKFSLAGHEMTVLPDVANAAMQYIICIKAAK